MATPSKMLASIGKNTGISPLFRAFNLAATMAETALSRYEHEQQLDQELLVAERDIKRSERAIEIADAQAEMESRIQAAKVKRELKTLQAMVDLSKIELDKDIAKSQVDRLAVFNNPNIKNSVKMVQIKAIQSSIEAKIEAYNSLFSKAKALESVTEQAPTELAKVDMSIYADFAEVTDEDTYL